MKSKAAILTKFNSPLVVDEVEIPKLKCGQVLVRVWASTICGAQIGEITGAKGPDRYLPHLLGHEGGGVVCEVGEGVNTVASNDHVVLHWREGSGIEADTPIYKWGSRKVGGGRVTTFSEFSVVSENRVTKIPNDISFHIASLFGCAVTTAFGLVNNEAKLKIGQSIAVAGCGGVGLNVIQGASLVSAYPIIGIDLNVEKLNLAGKLGATHFIRADEYPVWLTNISDIVQEKGIDVFVDCTGDVGTINMGYQITKPEGRMILVGQPRVNVPFIFSDARQHYCGKTLLDSQGGLTDPSIDIPNYLKLYKIGKLRMEEIITSRYALDEINVAVDKVMKGKEIGRCMITMQDC